MSKVRLKPEYEINSIRRADAIKDLFANKNLITIDDYTILVNGPERGWLEISIRKGNDKPYLIKLTEESNPLEDIREWLEKMSMFSSYPSECRAIDCETHDLLLSYDYLGLTCPSEISDNLVLIQISDTIADKDRTDVYADILQMVVPPRKFVRDFYLTIKNHIDDNEEKYLEHWDMPVGVFDDINVLKENFRSAIIEDYLESMKHHPFND